jgi:Oxidoreductase family, NAD-binding Rossmann fold
VAKIKAGVIGAGSHVAVYQNLHDVEVVAISDPVEMRLREVSQKYGGIDCYTDFRDLCARKDIQIVSIATLSRSTWSRSWASAGEGKHILLEKPISCPQVLAVWTNEGAEAANGSYDAWFERQLRGAIKEEIGYFVDCVRAGMTPTSRPWRLCSHWRLPWPW